MRSVRFWFYLSQPPGGWEGGNRAAIPKAAVPLSSPPFFAAPLSLLKSVPPGGVASQPMQSVGQRGGPVQMLMHRHVAAGQDAAPAYPVDLQAQLLKATRTQGGPGGGAGVSVKQKRRLTSATSHSPSSSRRPERMRISPRASCSTQYAIRLRPTCSTTLATLPWLASCSGIAALRPDQAGESTLPEFLEASWCAGVVRYDVDFAARTVAYFGCNGEEYIEAYPAVQIS